MRSRYARSRYVWSRYALGAVEVWVEVCSWCGRGTLSVWLRYAFGVVEVDLVRFVNFSPGNNVQLQYTIRTVYHIAGIFWPAKVVFSLVL